MTDYSNMFTHEVIITTYSSIQYNFFNGLVMFNRVYNLYFKKLSIHLILNLVSIHRYMICSVIYEIQLNFSFFSSVWYSLVHPGKCIQTYTLSYIEII